MKLFIVHVRQRRVRAVDVTKFAVMAETAEAALNAVKTYYPATVRGWREGAEFVLAKEVDSNVAVPV